MAILFISRSKYNQIKHQIFNQNEKKYWYFLFLQIMSHLHFHQLGVLAWLSLGISGNTKYWIKIKNYEDRICFKNYEDKISFKIMRMKFLYLVVFRNCSNVIKQSRHNYQSIKLWKRALFIHDMLNNDVE